MPPASRTKHSLDDLPLLWATPERWAPSALSDVFALLSDHAYLERKAASNALELLNRWPAPGPQEPWVSRIAGVARDESAHLLAVVRLLHKRGGKLERLHRSLYAGDLRALVRRGLGREELLDRVLISGVIEARSCERFGLLAAAAPDKELAEFYRGLWSSELGHYTVFLRLARQFAPAAEVEARWQQILEAESKIIQKQAVGPGIHSGCP